MNLILYSHIKFEQIMSEISLFLHKSKLLVDMFKMTLSNLTILSQC